MKKLTYICLLSGAFALLMISCNKDPLTSNNTQPPDTTSTSTTPFEQQISTVSITGSSADLTLYVHSNVPLSAPYSISISGLLREEFILPYGENKTWKLNNLRPGSYRVFLRQGEPNSSPYYFSLSFEITDHNGIHRVNPTLLSHNMYGFDIEVKN